MSFGTFLATLIIRPGDLIPSEERMMLFLLKINHIEAWATTYTECACNRTNTTLPPTIPGLISNGYRTIRAIGG